MKIIALLAIGAALALAANQDDKKIESKTESKPDSKTGSKPSSIAATPAKPGRPAAAASSQPAKRNVHRTAVTPAKINLTPEQQAAAALPQVPPGTQEVGPNLFRSTDAQGKHWMYRKTPFGVSKWEEKPGEPETGAESTAPAAAATSMTDLGDSVQFQRPTPFGPQKWTRKKSEMTEDEKAAFATQEHARQSALGTKPADAAKPPEQH